MQSPTDSGLPQRNDVQLQLLRHPLHQHRRRQRLHDYALIILRPHNRVRPRAAKLNYNNRVTALDMLGLTGSGLSAEP